MAINSKSFPTYFALFKVTFRQMFWSRRTALVLIGCLLPIAIALVFRFIVQSGGMVNRFIPQITLIYYGLLVDLCAIFYGTAIISDEIEGKGLTYLQMRPVRKSAILLSKFVAYFLGTIPLVAVSHLILTGVMVTHPRLNESVFFHFGMSLRYIGSLTLGLLVYGALAAALAAKFKNPVLWGLIFVMGWERITLNPLMTAGIKRLSISHYLFVLFPPYKLPRSQLNGFLGSSPPSAWVALLVLCLLTAVLLYLAIRVFRDREYLM